MYFIVFSVMGDIESSTMAWLSGGRWVDLGSFSLGKPHEKLPKSIPRVTNFLHIESHGESWWIFNAAVSKLGTMNSVLSGWQWEICNIVTECNRQSVRMLNLPALVQYPRPDQ